MTPISPNKSGQRKQHLSKSMKKKVNKKSSPSKTEGESSQSQVDDRMKAVELGPETSLKCNFCGKGPANDEMVLLKSGKFYKLHTMAIHFFCLLFAFNGVQKGEDEEGLNGFLVSDVQTQVDKGKKHKCMYCDKVGAMSKCQKKGCGKWLHFPCGLEAGATFQFLGNMDVFCAKHRIRQKQDLLSTTPPDRDCVVCYEEVEKDIEEEKKIVVPCCNRHFHRACVQNMALSSGSHHFKCPNCNNNKIYVEEIEKLGVYIPNRDATWETEEHSAFYNYRDMYVQERRCGVEECLCEKEEGRNFHEEEGEWEVVLCSSCGMGGSHVKCGGLDASDPEFNCKDCRKDASVEDEDVEDLLQSVEDEDIDDLLQSESDLSLGNSTLDLSSDTSEAGEEAIVEEMGDYSDMFIKFLNVRGEMTSSCLKCGYSIPAYKGAETIEHIKSKHVKTKKTSEPSADNAESKSELDLINELLSDQSDDEDSPVATSANNDSFVRKYDEESDELDRLLNSVKDDKDVEVEASDDQDVIQVIQSFDDENDELEKLLLEIEDGDGEDNSADGINDKKKTKESDVEDSNVNVLEDSHLKQQRLKESHKSKVDEVAIPKLSKSVPEKVEETTQSVDLSSDEEEEKPKYKPGPKSRKHKLAITPEPQKSDLKVVETEHLPTKVAIVKPEVKTVSAASPDVPPKETTMLFKHTSMKVLSQPLKQQASEDKSATIPPETSEDKLASIKEKIAALQHKTEVSSSSEGGLSTDNLEPQPRYKPGPKSRKSKLLLNQSTVKETDNIVDTSEKAFTLPVVSVEPKSKPGPKSKKIQPPVTESNELTNVGVNDVNELTETTHNTIFKRNADDAKPGPKSKKLKTQMSDKIGISNEDLQLILLELDKLANDINDNVFFIGDIKPKERHVIFTIWKLMDKSLPSDSSDILKCEQCNKTFSERCELSEHSSNQCTKKFESMFNIIEQQFLNKNDMNLTKKRIFDFIKEKVYSFFSQKWCFLCGKSVRMSSNISMPSYGLVSHMINSHFKKELSDECKSSKSPLTCPITKPSANSKPCGLKFSSQSLLLSHLAGYHARTDHILRNCSTINNLPGTKPLTKVCKCENCGKDVSNKQSLKIHLAIEKTDYKSVEMARRKSNKCGEKDCPFEVKFSTEEIIRHFAVAHLEIGKPFKIATMETKDNLNNTLDGLYADSSDDDTIDIVEHTNIKPRVQQKEPRRPNLKLVDINKLIQSPEVKEASPCSWYTIATNQSASFKRSSKTLSTPSSIKTLTTTSSIKTHVKTPLPTSVTPVVSSKVSSALSLKSNRVSPAMSNKTPSPTASQNPHTLVRNQTPPPVVLKNPLPTIAENRQTSTPQSVQNNKLGNRTNEPAPSNKTNSPVSSQSTRPTTVPSQSIGLTAVPSQSIRSPSIPSQSIRSTKPASKSVKTVPSNKSSPPVVTNPTSKIVDQSSINSLPAPSSETLQEKLVPAAISNINSSRDATKTISLPASATSNPSPAASASPTPVEAAPAPTRRSKRPFSCPICNGAFKTILVLKSHLSNLHFHNRLFQKVLQNGSTFSCMEEACPFQSNKKEDVIQHIGSSHETVFRIAKELFPNWILTETESTSSQVPQVPAIHMESASNDVPEVSTPTVPSQVSQSAPTPQISSATKRRSTELELNETDLKKQKTIGIRSSRKVDLPMKPKINLQTAVCRPLTRDIVSNKVVSSPVNKPQEKNNSEEQPGGQIHNFQIPQNAQNQMAQNVQNQLPQNVMILPQAVMENGQVVIPSQPYFLTTQGIMPQWAPAGPVNNQQWNIRNNFQMQ